MIGTCVFVRSRRHNSRPSMFGIARSVITRSGDQSFIISSAVSTSLATRMSYPWLAREVRSTRVIWGSSSTTRMCLCSNICVPAFVRRHARSVRFLGHDVHVHCRRVAQKLMDRRKIEISFPAPRGGASENNLRNVFLVHKFRDCLGYTLPFKPHHGCANVLRETHVRGQGSLIRFARVLSQIGVDNKELGIHGLRHTCSASDQILRRRIRADAYGNAFADGDRASIVIFLLLSAVLFQALIHRLGYLAQCQLAQSDQVRLAEKVFQRSPHALLRIHVAASHAVLQRLRSQVDHHHFVDSLQHPAVRARPHSACDACCPRYWCAPVRPPARRKACARESRPRPSLRRARPYTRSPCAAPLPDSRSAPPPLSVHGFPQHRSPHLRRECAAGSPRSAWYGSCPRREHIQERA